MARAEGENLVKLGRACYGCMAGYTDISASRNDASYPIPMWIQDGEKVVESIGLTIAGSIMSGIGSLSLVGLGIIRKAFKDRPPTSPEEPKDPSIEVLEAMRETGSIQINNPIAALHGLGFTRSVPKTRTTRGGEVEVADIDVSDASFPRGARVSEHRAFSDGGFTLHSREDFVSPGKQEMVGGRARSIDHRREGALIEALSAIHPEAKNSREDDIAGRTRIDGIGASTHARGWARGGYSSSPPRWGRPPNHLPAYPSQRSSILTRR